MGHHRLDDFGHAAFLVASAPGRRPVLLFRESAMRNGQGSLRRLIDKWLGHCGEGTVQVIEFSRTSSNRSRYIRVGGGRSESSLAITFFRHGDGSWNVYPPRGETPMMSTSLLAA
jgi:hypothetical protein